MENEISPKNIVADELESLRERIAQLQKILRHDSEADRHLPPELLQSAPLGIALIDSHYGILHANESFRRMLGYSEEEIRSLHIEDFAQGKNLCEQAIRPLLDGVRSSSKTELQFLTKTRETFWAQVTSWVIPLTGVGRGCCSILVENISDRKQADSSLQSEKQLLERLINSSVDGILAFDRDCRFTVWNAGMERIFGIRAQETVGRLAFDACPFLKEMGEDANFLAALKGEEVISRNRPYSIPETARQGYFEGYYAPMRNALDGEVTGGLAIIRDVTEREIAEEGKRISEERYRELFENAYDMVYTHDLTGKITSVNKAAERITGYSRSEALQMHFSQFIAPEFRDIGRRMIDRQIADEAPVTQELEIVARDGSRVILEVSNRLIFHEAKPVAIQGIARDITQRKKTEEALQQANRKLEAWVRELEQRAREMALLNEMGDILRACLTTEEVYEVIVRVAQEIFPGQGGALFVIVPFRKIVESMAEWGDRSQIELTFTPEECWALRRGRVHLVEDTRVGLLCRHLPTPPPRGYICVPMMAQSEALGILHLTQTEDAQMPEAKQRLAIAMAEHVAMALSNLRLHEKLRNQSIRDQLTGLFNRTFMEESLELELRRAGRTQHPLSVIMLALDDFQTMNDRFGLDVGESVLRRTGMLLQANVRKGDIACRYSGQTYVLILPLSSYEVSRERAESLCQTVRSLEVKHQTEQVGHVTASVGLAAFPVHGQTVETLLRSADAALNRARSGGGNCVMVAS
jgi:diguanylate cyclase (GGDEF)-like protein/PAS domain S-box-containing protein